MNGEQGAGVVGIADSATSKAVGTALKHQICKDDRFACLDVALIHLPVQQDASHHSPRSDSLEQDRRLRHRFFPVAISPMTQVLRYNSSVDAHGAFLRERSHDVRRRKTELGVVKHRMMSRRTVTRVIREARGAGVWYVSRLSIIPRNIPTHIPPHIAHYMCLVLLVVISIEDDTDPIAPYRGSGDYPVVAKPSRG